MSLVMVQDFLTRFTYIQANFPLEVALTLLMVLDFLTGTAAAIGTKTLSSNLSWRGVMKKAMTWMVVSLALVVEPLLGGIPITNIILLGAITTETLSIMENAGRLGVLPTQLTLIRDALGKLQVPTVTAAVSGPPGTHVEVSATSTAVPGGQRAYDPPAEPLP